jgi:hypothetical protein
LPPLLVADADPGESAYHDQRPEGGEHDGRHESADEAPAGEMFPPAQGDANGGKGPYSEGR